jgi:hypothetical protein
MVTVTDCFKTKQTWRRATQSKSCLRLLSLFLNGKTFTENKTNKNYIVEWKISATLIPIIKKFVLPLVSFSKTSNSTRPWDSCYFEVFQKHTRACYIQIALETMLLPIHTISLSLASLTFSA